ncbi:MAG: methylated-DNA--[protein]-cysteine S-methyltransferase [Opitutaceae bacterium]|jgi:methylated-DNA-[protein]-cysteine S-methyltransferase
MPHLLFPTALGRCGLAWNDAGLTAFALPERDDVQTAGFLAGHAGAGDTIAGLEEAPAWIRELVARVQKHLAGEAQDFIGVPLDYRPVSRFARRVYEATRTVPAGQTRTYGELAGMLEEPPGASRAIGAVLGANPWSLIVPCHRILGAKGRLTGFSAEGGVRTKARLLAIEGAQLVAE